VLDFGCGDGSFLKAATALGWLATGVEIQPEAARSRGLTVTDRIDDLSGTFDLITLWHSLEHTRSPREVLWALTDRLAREGTLIVAVPNFDSLQARLCKSFWFHLDVPRHLFHFTPFSLRRLLEGCGLEIIRRWDLELEMDLFGWTQSLLNRVLHTPNVLFDVLTRRGRDHVPWEIAASFLMAVAATLVGLRLVPLTADAGSGAVVIFAARRGTAG
jgi:SAM-dependent methyltransferase